MNNTKHIKCIDTKIKFDFFSLQMYFRYMSSLEPPSICLMLHFAEGTEQRKFSERELVKEVLWKYDGQN